MSAGSPPPARQRLDDVLENLSRKPGWVLGFAVLFALGPFLGKPFHMDDPLFIWAAQHIRSHPLDPYGFTVNWYGWEQPMWEVTKNPPLASYYLAGWASLAGWSELSLHAALLLPAWAALAGTYRLARRFCERPLLAALVTLLTPVFLVSGTTVMCDMLMLGLWIWALELWMAGSENGNHQQLAGAAFLIGLAALTKYFGACLVLLAAAWSLARRHRPGRWLPWLSIPVVMLVAYQFATRKLYGRGLLSDAGAYVVVTRKLHELSLLEPGIITLTFAGGCLAVVVLFAPWLWSRRALALGLAAVALLTVVLTGTGWLLKPLDSTAVAQRFWRAAQISFWLVGGGSVLALGLTDLHRRRDAPSLLLNCWVWGTLLFSAVFNWIVTARTLLPMVAAVGILLARRLQDRSSVTVAGIIPPLVLGAILALATARADFLLAAATHENVARISHTIPTSGSGWWFEGHWGFQYYMQLAGARPLDIKTPRIRPGDRLALPLNNSNVHTPDPTVVRLDQVFREPVNFPVATHSGPWGAGFYASVWGPLPFAFAWPPPEEVHVYVFQPPPAPAPPPR